MELLESVVFYLGTWVGSLLFVFPIYLLIISPLRIFKGKKAKWDWALYMIVSTILMIMYIETKPW